MQVLWAGTINYGSTVAASYLNIYSTIVVVCFAPGSCRILHQIGDVLSAADKLL